MYKYFQDLLICRAVESVSSLFQSIESFTEPRESFHMRDYCKMLVLLEKLE